MNHIPPLRIVLSGGGVRGLAYVGCFLELEKRNLLKNLNEILGVSCGSLFGFAYTIGYSPNELKEFVTLFDFSLIQHLEPEVVFDFFQTYGVDNGHNLERLLESMLKAKGFSPTITFQELYEKTRIYLRVYATNLNSSTFDEFSYKASPTIKVIDGIIASCAIPFYFTPRTINNNTYVDGGVLNNYPIDIVNHHELQNTLGFLFDEDKSLATSINTIQEFWGKIYSCFNISYNKPILKHHDKHTIIIPSGKFVMWNFGISSEKRIELIELGKKAVEDFLHKTTVQCVRRYSVS